MNYFITAIGTDSGKTIVSAIFCKALNASYWKPVQAGQPTDRDRIIELVPEVRTYKEAYLLSTPESPHAASIKEGVVVKLEDFQMPDHVGNLIIEGAGGLMVPINEDDLMIDLVQKLNTTIILVCNLYLGSINHSLLSIEALKSRKLKIAGIVFNGNSNEDSERIILKHAQAPCLLHIKNEKHINTTIIEGYAKELLKNMNLETV